MIRQNKTLIISAADKFWGGLNHRNDPPWAEGEVKMAKQNKWEDELVKAVMAPGTSFKASLIRMQNEVYQCTIDLERIEKWEGRERKAARMLLQNINKGIHSLERLFGE